MSDQIRRPFAIGQQAKLLQELDGAKLTHFDTKDRVAAGVGNHSTNTGPHYGSSFGEISDQRIDEAPISQHDLAGVQSASAGIHHSPAVVEESTTGIETYPASYQKRPNWAEPFSLNDSAVAARTPFPASSDNPSPAKFLKKAPLVLMKKNEENKDAIVTIISDPIANFVDFGVPQKLAETLKRYMEVVSPTDLQKVVFQMCLSNGFSRNTIIQGPLGSGKTLAYLIPIVISILATPPQQRYTKPRLSNLILCPSHMLAAQVAQEVEDLTLGLGIVVKLLTGGSGKHIGEHAQEAVDCDIAVFTPGRLADMGRYEKNRVSGRRMRLLGPTVFDNVKTFVMDKAAVFEGASWVTTIDDLHNMGGLFNRHCYIVLVTSTKLARSSTRDPSLMERLVGRGLDVNYVGVDSAPDSTLCSNIEFFVRRTFPEKLVRTTDYLKKLHLNGGKSTLVMCNTNYSSAIVNGALQFARLDSQILDSTLTVPVKTQRQEAFLNKEFSILVTTGENACGLNYNVDTVVLFDLPSRENAMEEYMGRVARCGRMGRKGTVIVLVTQEDEKMTELILEHMKVKNGHSPQTSSYVSRLQAMFGDRNIDFDFDPVEGVEQ